MKTKGRTHSAVRPFSWRRGTGDTLDKSVPTVIPFTHKEYQVSLSREKVFRSKAINRTVGTT